MLFYRKSNIDILISIFHCKKNKLEMAILIILNANMNIFLSKRGFINVEGDNGYAELTVPVQQHCRTWIAIPGERCRCLLFML